VDRYDEGALGKIAADLTPMEKARLYAEGTIPRRLGTEQSKVLRAGMAEVAREFDAQPEYEGLTGASAREIRTVLLDASQHPLHACLSPLGVFDQIDALSEKGDYEFLQHKPESGYHDHHDFLKQVRRDWLELIDREVRTSTGLVEESRYEELFEKYITHVSLWLKGERYRDPITGDYSDPDQTLLKRVESILEVKNAEDFRRNLINMIAAHAIDHPGAQIEHKRIFPRYVEQVKEAYFIEHRAQIAQVVADMLALLSDAGSTLSNDGRRHASEALERLLGMGYCKNCAREALGELMRERYST
jgi:predicted Ser/Thr protein kinase